MKNTLLLFFCFCCTFSFAQKNELSTAYQINTDKNLGKGISFSYYRHVASNRAIGLKAFYAKSQHEYFDGDMKAIGFDATHRWSLLKWKKARLMVETGIAALQTLEESSQRKFVDINRSPIGYILLPSDFQNYFYLGYTVGLAFDVQILKLMTLGLGYNYNEYITNQKPQDENTASRSSLHVTVGVRF